MPMTVKFLRARSDVDAAGKVFDAGIGDELTLDDETANRVVSAGDAVQLTPFGVGGVHVTSAPPYSAEKVPDGQAHLLGSPAVADVLAGQRSGPDADLLGATPAERAEVAVAEAQRTDEMIASTTRANQQAAAARTGDGRPAGQSSAGDDLDDKTVDELERIVDSTDGANRTSGMRKPQLVAEIRRARSVRAAASTTTASAGAPTTTVTGQPARMTEKK